MPALAKILIVLVALLHLQFLVLEMFLWTRPLGLRIFRQSPEVARGSAVLAANQGLYNGFLAAGLLWGLMRPYPFGRETELFFLACVTVAGIFGALTANKRIFFVQAMPAIAAAVALFLSGPGR